MKIAFCHHYSMSFWSGGEKQVAYLAQKLQDDGFSVEIHSLPIGRKDISPDLGDVKYTEGWMQKIDADVAYVVYAPYVDKFFRFNNKTRKIAAIRGFPLAPEIQHKSVITLSPLKRIQKIGILRSLIWWHSQYMRSFAGYDAIHVISPAMKDIFTPFNKRVYSISNWIDTSQYTPCKEKNSEFTVLYASRDDWVKGMDIYDKIASSKEPGIRFIATIERKGNFEGIGFIPDSKNLSSIYSSAHVTIVPTRIDTFGNTIPESLSCGTPVITSKIPAHESMRLPLIYADSADEYLHEIRRLKKMWEDDRSGYYELSRSCRNSVAQYDFKSAYQRFVDMFTAECRT